jgi:ATP synthase mitochondrial F1 complex assembly factor 1
VYGRILETALRHPRFILPIPREVESPPAGSSPSFPTVSSQRQQQPTVADIHFLQWTHPTPNTSTVLFTHLAEFKARGEQARPHTTVTHHTDLLDGKGIVLLEGNVMTDQGAGVTVEDGKWLVMCVQKFYGGWDGVGTAFGMASSAGDAAEPGNARRADAQQPAVGAGQQRRLELLRRFSAGDQSFNIQELIEEADRI